MLFSVIVPVYNVEKYIKACLNSIINQNFDDYEIILIDDGSTDLSGNICDEYAKLYSSKIRVIHKRNGGLLSARRDGYKLAVGEYILNCDSDDFFSPNSFRILADTIDKYNPDIIQYDLYFYKDGNSWNSNSVISPFSYNVLYDDMSMLREVFLQHEYMVWSLCGKCYKKSCIDSNFDYSSYRNIKFGEDTLQSFEIYDKANSYIYIKDKIYNYRMLSGMMATFNPKSIEDTFEIAKIYKKFSRKWGFTNYEVKSDAYFLRNVYQNLWKISNDCHSLKESKNLFSYIYENPDYSRIFAKYSRKEITPIYLHSKEYFLLWLLFNKRSFILYLLMKTRQAFIKH